MSVSLFLSRQINSSFQHLQLDIKLILKIPLNNGCVAFFVCVSLPKAGGLKKIMQLIFLVYNI